MTGMYARTGMMVLNNGGQFINKDGTKFQLTSPEVRETLEFHMRLVKIGLMRAHDGSTAGGYKELLPETKMVFQHAVPARIPVYRQQQVDFGTCFYPLGPKNATKTNYSLGTTYGYTVFKTDTTRVQAALQAALWAARPESGLLFARGASILPSTGGFAGIPSGIQEGR